MTFEKDLSSIFHNKCLRTAHGLGHVMTAHAPVVVLLLVLVKCNRSLVQVLDLHPPYLAKSNNKLWALQRFLYCLPCDTQCHLLYV